MEGTADHPDAPAAGKERYHGQLEAGRHDGPDVLQLAKEAGLVVNRDGPGQELLLVDPGLVRRRNAGEDVSREEGLGEALRFLWVPSDAGNQRQVMFKPFGGEQRREFLLAAGTGVARVPAFPRSRPQEEADRRVVALEAQAGDDRHAGGRRERQVPELLPLVDVGDVDLDGR